jgi:hypothetical protein
MLKAVLRVSDEVDGKSDGKNGMRRKDLYT